MKKTMISILAALLVIMLVDAAFAEAAAPKMAGLPVSDPMIAEQDGEFAQERASVMAAVQAKLPGAVIDYLVREYDDRRFEWDVFFRQDGVLGQAEVLENGFEVRKVELFNQSRENSLTASEAVAKLMAEKGEMKILKLDLDWDDGRLVYEGDAEMNQRFYEFEISADGRLVEWERD